MHGHCALEDTRDQDMANAFDLFDVTSSDAANVESIVRKEFFSLSKGLLEIPALTVPF